MAVAWSGHCPRLVRAQAGLGAEGRKGAARRSKAHPECSMLTEDSPCNFPVVCNYPVSPHYLATELMVGSYHGDQVLFSKGSCIFFNS